MAKKKKTPDYYSEILVTFKELRKSCPHCTIGMHISTALDDLGDLWGSTDAEILRALKTYSGKIQMDVIHTDTELERIVEDGMNLKNILSSDDDDYEDPYYG
jgi:hypothetical protein